MDYAAYYGKFAKRYLGRPLGKADAVKAAEISKAEKRLKVRLPEALRVYYRVAGNADELNKIHNELYAPDELEVEGDYLVFMDENQFVVSWGIRLADLAKKNPTVWQRNNTPPVEWYSEEKSFTAFMKSMFEWYREGDLWEIS